MLGAIMGIGAGIAKGIMGNQAKKDQFEENKQLMEYQAKLNKQQAFYSTGLAKDLWNYTNYENTMRHIKGAGLSPGLIYGQSGAGGSTSGAGQASGVGQPSKTGTEVGLQAQGMALQLANVMSQTRLSESQAEKKRNEIFQMAMLEPKLAILDETDSGLDIDALRIVSNGVNALKTDKNATIVITHYQRLLDYIVPDFVHVLHDGKIVKTGPKELALELEEKGYDWLK